MNHLQLRFLTETFVLLLCLILLGGCGGTAKTETQRHNVSLADIRVMEMRTLETTFLAGLRILNPSETPIIIQGISCDLNIDGHHFASGLSGKQHEIPAYETAVISVPIYASTLDMVTAILQHTRTDVPAAEQAAPLRYELKGTIRIMQGESETAQTIAFSATGEMTPAGLRDEKESAAE